MDDVTLAHPLVDAVGPGFVVHETDAAVVECSSERTGLLLEARRAGVVVVLLTPGSSRLTAAMSAMLRRTASSWVVRDGTRYRAAGSDVVADDVATAMLAPQTVTRSAATGPGSVPWVEALVSVHHHASDATTLGRTAELLLAGLAGVGPTAWGTVEPATLPWTVAEVTAYARRRAPRPTRLVAVAPTTGGVASAQLRVERSATGVTEETRLVLPRPVAPDTPPTDDDVAGVLADLAQRQRVLLGTAWRTSGHPDATVSAHQLPLPVPLGAVVGAAAVRDLGVDLRTLPTGARAVGPARGAVADARLHPGRGAVRNGAAARRRRGGPVASAGAARGRARAACRRAARVRRPTMSAEWVVLSPRHVDAAVVVAAAAAEDPAIGIRQLWEGDALQLVAADGVVLLTLFQSRELVRTVDAARLLGTCSSAAPLFGGDEPVWWTSVHAAAQDPSRAAAARIVRDVAAAAGGLAVSRSVGD